MNKEELKKLVEQELQWLRYYANEESRKSFVPTKSPYEQLVSIGYCKRVFPLKYRCVFDKFTASNKVQDTPIEEIIRFDGSRNIENDNVFSALELFLIKFPEDHDWVVKSLQSNIEVFPM